MWVFLHVYFIESGYLMIHLFLQPTVGKIFEQNFRAPFELGRVKAHGIGACEVEIFPYFLHHFL